MKNNDGLLVIFVHKGYADYLELAIRQVRFFCPAARVVLLGDRENEKLSCIVEHFPLVRYHETASQFESEYVHLSYNDLGYERFCLQRWLIVGEFLKKEQISSSVFVLDSDVLIYLDLVLFCQTHLDGRDYTMCHHYGPQFSFFRSPAVLAEFGSRIVATYQERRAPFQALESFFADFQSRGVRTGGVTDMNFVHSFGLDLGDRALDLGKLSSLPFFDENISQPDGFVMDGRSKRVTWEGKTPAYSREPDRYRVRVGGIHFQGGEKALMGHFYRGPGFFSWPLVAFRFRKWLRDLYALAKLFLRRPNL